MPVIQCGSFTSDGGAKQLSIRSDVDYITVWNYTNIADAASYSQFRWQRGFADGYAFRWTADTVTVDLMTSGGFTLIDPNEAVGAAVTGTTITKADPPVCSATAHGYSDNDIVVLSNLTEMTQLGGAYFEIGSTATNSFELTWMDTNTSNFTQESAFEVRKVPKYFTWIPRNTVITALTAGTTTSVVLSVTAATAGYSVGDVVRFNMPLEWGPVSLDGVTAEITAIDTSTNALTLDYNSSGATSFAWPATTAVPLTYAQLIPVGTNSGSSIADRTRNTDILGIELGGTANGPGGASDDVIFWEAGKCDLVQTS